MIYVYLGI